MQRGFALIEVVVAGVVLAIGLAAVVSISSQALSMQRRGEFDVAAASILDQLLAEALMTGPDDFSTYRPVAGPCDAPWEDFQYEVIITVGDPGSPADVSVLVKDPIGRSHSVSTRLATRPELSEIDEGDLDSGEARDRRPEEPLDREMRHEQLEGASAG